MDEREQDYPKSNKITAGTPSRTAAFSVLKEIILKKRQAVGQSVGAAP